MKHSYLPLTLLLGGLLLSSCVDKDYDIDDIDLTLGSNVDLALPLLNTTEIKLADFVLPNSFLDKTAIPGENGEVIYAHAVGSFSTTIPAVMNGSIDYTADAINIKIADLPDFLKSDKVCFDLKNPVLVANVSSTLPGGCTIAADFTISTPEAKCVVKGLKAQNGTVSQYIALADDNNIPATIYDKSKGAGRIAPAEGTTVSGLFSGSIPEELKIQVNKLTAEGVSMPQMGDYKINVSLTFYAPICIGSQKFQLVYEATEQGWIGDIDSELRKADISALELKANLTNNLPLGAEVEVKPIDQTGSVINGLSALNVQGAAGTTSPVSYIFKSTQPGKTIRDYLNGSNGAQKLDGIKVTTTLKASAQSVGKYLTTKSSVRFTDLQLRAKGQITYDAN